MVFIVHVQFGGMFSSLFMLNERHHRMKKDSSQPRFGFLLKDVKVVFKSNI
jgi:hypothetical protein